MKPILNLRRIFRPKDAAAIRETQKAVKLDNKTRRLVFADEPPGNKMDRKLS